MHMGSMAIVGQASSANLLHVILNNGRHDSVGGQPTCGLEINFTTIAEGCGYQLVRSANDETELINALDAMSDLEGPLLLDVRIGAGHRKDLGRPEISPQDQKRNFMRHLLD
jgi:phosphonopyruvate decarboxylase